MPRWIQDELPFDPPVSFAPADQSLDAASRSARTVEEILLELQNEVRQLRHSLWMQRG